MCFGNVNHCSGTIVRKTPDGLGTPSCAKVALHTTDRFSFVNTNPLRTWGSRGEAHLHRGMRMQVLKQPTVVS